MCVIDVSYIRLKWQKNLMVVSNECLRVNLSQQCVVMRPGHISILKVDYVVLDFQNRIFFIDTFIHKQTR